MQGLDPRTPFGIQAIMAMVEKELVAHNKPNIQVSIAMYPHRILVENLWPNMWWYSRFWDSLYVSHEKQDGSQVPGWSGKPGIHQKEAS